MRKCVVQLGHVGDDGLLVGVVHVHILRVEQLLDTELAVRSIEGVAKTLTCRNALVADLKEECVNENGNHSKSV